MKTVEVLSPNKEPQSHDPSREVDFMLECRKVFVLSELRGRLIFCFQKGIYVLKCCYSSHRNLDTL